MKTYIIPTFKLSDFADSKLSEDDKTTLLMWLFECNAQFRYLIEEYKNVNPKLVNKFNHHYKNIILKQCFFPLIKIWNEYHHKHKNLKYLQAELSGKWYNSMTTPIDEYADFSEIIDLPDYESLFTRREKNALGWGCPDDIEAVTVLSNENPIDCIKFILFTLGSFLKQQLRVNEVSSQKLRLFL